MPSVRIWDMEDQLHPQIAEMTKGHKFGVACVVCKINTSIKHRIILACTTDRTELVKSICECKILTNDLGLKNSDVIKADDGNN